MTRTGFDPTDPGDVLAWLYGEDAVYRYLNKVIDGQRRGQAFMNTLFEYDQAEYIRLTGSSFDPFYVDAKIPLALDKLTSK